MPEQSEGDSRHVMPFEIEEDHPIDLFIIHENQTFLQNPSLPPFEKGGLGGFEVCHES